MNRLIRGLVAVVLTSVLVGVVGCGSDDDGLSGPQTDPVVDLSQLDVGNFPTQPHIYEKPVDIEQARIVEAWRLGNTLPLPAEIDPALRYVSPQAAGPHYFLNASASAYKKFFLGDGARLDNDAKGLLFGFLTHGQTDLTPGLSVDVANIVMLFETEQNAATAAESLERSNVEYLAGVQSRTPGEQQGSTPVDIGKYPTSHAHSSFPGSISSWYATGRYVIATQISDQVKLAVNSTDISPLVPYVEKSIDANARAVANFSPTPSDQLMQINVDPDRMMSRALATAATEQSLSGNPSVHDRHGGIQLSTNPEEDTRLFEEAGVDRVAWNGNDLYRARDAAGARRIVQEHSSPTRRLRTIDSPPNLPTARCLAAKFPEPQWANYYCSVSFDRYAATVTANQLTDAYQRVSAQYARLANSR